MPVAASEAYRTRQGSRWFVVVDDRRGQAPPAVPVNRRATVSCFLDHPTVQTLLLHADSVVVARDHESTERKQAETDAAHDLQIAHFLPLV